jgi:hypothetical protein
MVDPEFESTSDAEAVAQAQSQAQAESGPSPSADNFNSPVDDPRHYDFSMPDVPMDPEEKTPKGHRQHEGGYTLDS